MKVRLDESDPDEDSAAQKVLGGVSEKYSNFNNLVAFNDADSIPIFLVKLLARVIGILFMLALSPIVLIILVVAILVAL